MTDTTTSTDATTTEAVSEPSEKVVLSVLLHGESGSGKSTLAGTAPTPRLVLDAEGGSHFVKSNRRRKRWDPLTGPPPVDDGTWDACFVKVLDWATLEMAYAWLIKLGADGPFRSVVIDSLTEGQKRLGDAVSGVEQPSLQQWGQIGRKLQDMIRKFRDLAQHDNKISQVVTITLSQQRASEEQIRPMISGQTGMALPGYFDVVGYCFTQQDSATNETGYYVLVEKIGNIVAKDRTTFLKDHYKTPSIKDPNLTEWLEVVAPAFTY